MMKARMEWTVKFLRYLMYRFIDDKLSNIAATLTLTSLLALIPLLAVVFSILSALPLAENLGQGIESFIFSNFVPAFGTEIKTTVHGFVDKASAMQTLGFSSLVVTAILLLRTIDTAFNQIWHTQQQRKALMALLIYWSVLIVGPLLLGASIALSSYFASVILATDAGRHIGGFLILVLPWLLTTLGLAILYLVIPNAKIRFSHALVGAIVAGLLFELAKQLFTMYVISFPLQEIIFGALSAVPLFIIWVYLSWLVILLGAEVCHGLAVFKPEREEKYLQDNHFLDCLMVLRVINQQSDQNQYLGRIELLDCLDGIKEGSLADCLNELVGVGLIEEKTSGCYAMVGGPQDLEQQSIYSLIQSHRQG